MTLNCRPCRPSSIFPTALALPVSLVASLIAPSPAKAVNFRLNFAGNVSGDLQSATREAANQWSSLLKDDTVVDLRIEYTDLSALGGAVLGGAQPAKIEVEYKKFVDALFKDAVSSNDFAGLNSLQLSSQDHRSVRDLQSGKIKAEDIDLGSESFAYLAEGTFSQKQNFIDNNGNYNNKYVRLTRAQAKSLDLLEYKEPGLDAVLKLNSKVDWDFNQRDGIDSDRYDAVSVLKHEIGHALGIVSGVDSLDFLAASSQPVNIERDDFSYLTPMDFYRYSDESASAGVMDLTLGGSEKYFSLNRGGSAVADEFGRSAYFSTGSLSANGDGYQGSHWKATAGTALGVMNPSLQKGQSNAISQLDLTLLDVVGWDLEDTKVERAAAIGLDWTQLEQQLNRERSATVSKIESRWSTKIPGLIDALDYTASEIEQDFNQEIHEQFDKLEEEYTKERSADKRREAFDEFYKKVDEASEKRNEELGKLPEKIYDTDKDVRGWKEFSVNELAKELRESEIIEVNRFIAIARAGSDQDRAELEPKLEAALSQFADKPNDLVKELLDTSGPANHIGFGFDSNWWFWFQLATEGDSAYKDLGIENGLLYSTAAPSRLYKASQSKNAASTEIPEPSSVLALFGIAALGANLTRKQR